LNVQTAAAEKADLKDNTYDLIYFNGSSSCIEDLEGSYKKCFCSMKSGGHLIVFDIPKESAYGMMYLLAKHIGSYSQPDMLGITPELPYPIELVNTACWHTVERIKEALINSQFSKDITYMQTLCNDPFYTDKIVEDVREGYKEGGYVAIIAKKL
jgi:hypothetical protein